MKQVSEKEFYEKIKKGNLDVILSVQGKYPYKTIFKFRNGIEMGFQNEKGEYFIY